MSRDPEHESGGIQGPDTGPGNPPEGGSPRQVMTRRRFAIVGTQVVGAGVTVILGVPIVGFLLSPLFRSKALVWRRAGNLYEVPVGTPTKLEVDFPPHSAWGGVEERYAVYVYRYGDQLNEVRVFSNICTHMECPVRWEPSLGLFLCPCHGGLYDLTGLNVGGPPPKPLPQWVHEIRSDGTIFVRNQLNEFI